MNQVKYIIYKLFLLTCCLLCCDVINAYDFEIDGIYYNKRFNKDKEVEVTYKVNSSVSYNGDVEIPSTVSYSGVTYKVTAIGKQAFYGCGHSVKSVTLPNSILTIGNAAFKSLWDITSIEIPSSVVTIDNQAFCDCQSLTSIDIPENVSSIGVEAFDYCLKLQTVTLHNSLITIGDQAFSRCGKLKKLAFLIQ